MAGGYAVDTILAGAMGCLLLTAAITLAAEGPATGAAATRSAASQPEGAPLKVLMERRGMLFGVAAVGRLLADPESPYAKAVARECSVITPENDMKFGPLRPAADKWNWGSADSLLAFAEKHGIKIHGHTLVWHEQVPKWVTETKRTPQECRDLMLAHIEAVAGRFRGRIYAWDVVNEAIEKDGTLRKTYWKDNVGPDYIDLAFRKAHEVDPKAKLVYNDYAMEGGGKKADAVYDLVKGMKARGVPIDAAGFQCHWEVGKYPALEDIRANIKRFHDLGLEVWVTELDLRVKAPAMAEDLARQAEAYASLVRMFVETGAVRSIQTWGLDDGHSWIPHSSPGYGDALLLDRDLRAKPAYFAIMKALSETR
jgi:endo-1,4-beta-xylanase